MSRYWKTIVAVVGAVVMFVEAITNDVNTALGDDVITGAEWRTIAIAAVTAIIVYVKANTPPAGQPSDPNVSETGR